MTNEEVIKLQNHLIKFLSLGRQTKKDEKTEEPLKGAKFSYAVVKNAKNISKYYEKCIKEFLDVPGYRNYIAEEMQLRGNCMAEVKDKEGKVTSKRFDDKKFNEEIRSIKEKYKDVLELHDKKEAEYEKFLKEEAKDIFIHKISKDDLPVNITPEQTNAIWLMIREEEEKNG